jgi:copper chaperone CopZ
MKKIIAVAAALVLTAGAAAETVKLRLNGVLCDGCKGEIITAIESNKGARVKNEPTKANPNATVDIDFTKTDLGAIAKSVAAADTPHKGDQAPAAFLVLDAKNLTEASAKKLPDALAKVKGVDAKMSKAEVKSKEIVIRLDDKGGAKLDEIKKALADLLK